MNDLISIIVPVYNVEKYLKNCIDSLIRQTHKDIEIVLVDDGSTDSSGKICDEYLTKDERIKVFHKENGGLSDARNYGLKNSLGNLITFVDSDDVVANNYVELLCREVSQRGADVVVATFKKIDEELPKIEDGNSVKYKILSQQEAVDRMLYNSEVDMASFITAWGKLIKREIVEKHLFPVGKIHEDEFTTYKWYLNADKIIFINSIIYGYRIRKNSITQKSYRISKLDAIEAFEERLNILKNKRMNTKKVEKTLYYLIMYNLYFLKKSEYVMKYREMKKKKNEYFISLWKSSKFTRKIQLVLMFLKGYIRYRIK